VRQLFEQFDYSSAPYLWSHRQRSTGGSGFQGYYHWHQGCELLYVHEGAGHVFVDRHSYDIRGGMLFYFQPFQLHNVRVRLEDESSSYVRTVFHFDPVALEPYIRPYAELHRLYVSLWKGRLPVQAFDLMDRSAYADGLIDAAELSYRQHARAATNVETSALYLLQLLACIRIDHDVEQAQPALRRPERYSETIMQWLESHYAEPFDLDRLAEELHLSKSYVSRIFKQETGSSITDYLMARRIKEACRLLQTSTLSVERIGIEVGLPNASYFVQLFKRMIGMTPRRYREGAST